MLSLHSKQLKHGMVSCEKVYIENMAYPRASEATITYAESGETEVIKKGENIICSYFQFSLILKLKRNKKKCI